MALSELGGATVRIEGLVQHDGEDVGAHRGHRSMLTSSVVKDISRENIVQEVTLYSCSTTAEMNTHHLSNSFAERDCSCVHPRIEPPRGFLVVFHTFEVLYLPPQD